MRPGFGGLSYAGAGRTVVADLSSMSDVAWSCGSMQNPRDVRLATRYRERRPGKASHCSDISYSRVRNRNTRALFAPLQRRAFQARFEEFFFHGKKVAMALCA